jgi:sugar/nucleoside kinase (ribokinase family)
LGGSSNYFSLAASLYAPVRVVGVVGEDYLDADIKILSQRGVDTKGIVKKPGNTFHWEGRYKGDMNHAETIATHLNVFEKFNPELPKEYTNSEVVFLANIDPDIQLKVLDQVKNPELVILDTMNYWIQSKLSSLKNVLKKTDILLVNEGEATLLTGEQNAIGAAQSLVHMGPKVVIIKRGEYGSVMFYDNNYFVLPAYPLPTVVDPTGAGDTFAGGFVGYLCEKNGTLNSKNLKKACFEGSLLASFTVQDFGLRKLQQITKAEIEMRWKDYFNSVQLDLG